MDKLRIVGGRRLQGMVTISGARNAIGLHGAGHQGMRAEQRRRDLGQRGAAGRAWTLLTDRIRPTMHSDDGIVELRRRVGDLINGVLQ